MLIFGSPESRFLSRIQDGLKPLLHLMASNVRVRFVRIAQEEDGRVVEKKFCPVLLRNDNVGLFLSFEEQYPRWYLSYANVDGVWLFKLGECDNPEIILQVFSRQEIQEIALLMVEDFYERKRKALERLEEMVDSLRRSFAESVEQEEPDVVTLIA